MSDTTGEVPILRARNLTRTYPDGDVQALRGVSLEVQPRESVAITGPSGCGKSTLLHLLGGLDRPSAGEVEFSGTPLSRLDLNELRARKLGFVFQSFFLMPTLNCARKCTDPHVRRPLAPPPASRKGRKATQ